MQQVDRPTLEQLNQALKKRQYHDAYRRAFSSTIWVLTVVVAAAIICSTFFISVLRIQGSSMSPALEDKQLVLVWKTDSFQRGDVVAFYYNNKILLKRVVGIGGDWIDIQEDGTVFVNEKALDEPYVTDKTRGECDLQFPYQVPEEKCFVLGDHRSTSVDSRSAAVGNVSGEQVLGEVVFRLWPLSKVGSVS